MTSFPVQTNIWGPGFGKSVKEKLTLVWLNTFTFPIKLNLNFLQKFRTFSTSFIFLLNFMSIIFQAIDQR